MYYIIELLTVFRRIKSDIIMEWIDKFTTFGRKIVLGILACAHRYTCSLLMSHILSQMCCAVSDCGNYVASGSSGQQGSGSELTVRI